MTVDAIETLSDEDVATINYNSTYYMPTTVVVGPPAGPKHGPQMGEFEGAKPPQEMQRGAGGLRRPRPLLIRAMAEG